MPNQFGWNLPLTDSMLEEESPYAPLGDPASNVAERLVMLAHLSFNSKVWGYHTGRGVRYWTAFGEHVEGSTNNADVASWWGALMTNLPGVPLRATTLLHEKNLLCHPLTLPGTQVEDGDVLAVLRTHTLDLRDRTRVWAKIRREARSAAKEAMESAEQANDDEETA